MPPHQPFTLRWGLMATGGIAETFAKDLLTNPALRETEDVRHELAAVASSTSKDRAAAFVKRIDGPSSAACYGSYAELTRDANIDIIYVATPHSHHFQNAMLALEAGKNVLCEKPMTITAAQSQALVKKARLKNLFLMEAVWTRFFPLSEELRNIIKSGAIGNVMRTIADFSLDFHHSSGKLNLDDSHRLVNQGLAGGALYDLGVYPLNWIFHTLYHTQPQEEKEKPLVTSAINKYESGVDEMTTIICQFPNHHAMGIAMTTLRIATDPDGKGQSSPVVRIQGSKGEIQIFGNAARPNQLKVFEKEREPYTLDGNCPRDPDRKDWGHGMYWEADECARCVRDGRLESATMPLDETILIVETMETALRKAGITYPDVITTDVYDADSALNTGST